MNQPDPAEDPDPSPEPLCVVCGQAHSPEENHFYTYTEDVDDDLICHICLQALLDPLDTPCGHTYCTVCLTNFLVEKDFCPVDRKPLVLQHCKKSNILVNKLLNKLLVTCPFTEHCTEVLQRCDLEHHFQTREGGASLVAQLVKNPPAVRETWVRSLVLEEPLKKGKATHSSILAWRIPWTV